tara:strand:- start:327 stop:542 length:216 start_codon:yes stop_codon:yes gene_type:complete
MQLDTSVGNERRSEGKPIDLTLSSKILVELIDLTLSSEILVEPIDLTLSDAILVEIINAIVIKSLNIMWFI